MATSTPIASSQPRLDNERLVQDLEEGRLKSRLSLVQLAERLGISRLTFYRLRDGRPIEVTTLAILCRFTKKRMDTYITWESA